MLNRFLFCVILITIAGCSKHSEVGASGSSSVTTEQANQDYREGRMKTHVRTLAEIAADDKKAEAAGK